MKSLFTLILAAVFLMSCTSRPPNTIIPTAFAFTSLPTVSVTAVPVSTSTIATVTPESTLTLYPTRTKEPTKTIDPVLATREAALDSCRGDSQNRLDKYIYQAYSSNDQWNAIICQDNGIYTKVSNSTLGVTWNVQPVDNGPSVSGPEWFWEPFLWSDNGKYLYLRSEPLGSIDSPWLRHSSGFGLSRLNLETGNIDVWLKPSHGGYSFGGCTILCVNEGRTFVE